MMDNTRPEEAFQSDTYPTITLYRITITDYDRPIKEYHHQGTR